MQDRELLELAAKAADLRHSGWIDAVYWGEHSGLHMGPPKPWNPLEDDGDALRLAAALKLTVDFENGSVWGPGALDETRLARANAANPCFRRAIVLAAAEIAKSS